MDDLIAKALHAARHHLAEGGFLDKLFSGPDYLSTGEEVSPTNWGNPDVASDFFKTDKALRLAREIQAKADAEARRPPIPDRVVEEAPSLPRAALRVAAEPSPQMAAMLARAETDPDKIEGRAAPEADKIAARAPQGPELTDRDRDLIIRTIAAETSGKTPEESQAIAHVILNRIQSGKYGASPEAVLLAKKQFEPWSNPAGANYPMRFLPNSRRYGMGQAALEAALSGDDITGGALNFWGPKAQYALGRKAPGWAAQMPDYSDIGETRFHRPRAHGGEVDDALRVVREHHADGEAVGPTMQQRLREVIASIDPEASRDRPVMDPEKMGEAWDRARRNYQNFPVQEGEATAREFVPSVRQEIGAAIAGEGGGKTYGSELRRRAAEFAAGSSGLDTGIGALDFVPYAGQALGATDIAHDIKQGDYVGAAEGAALPVAMTAAQKFAGPIGRGLSYAGEKIAEHARPIAGAAGTAAALSPDDAEALFAGRLAKTANLKKLALAEQMAKEGAHRNDIIGKTGWFQGSDGKWRFEIPDNEAVFNWPKDAGARAMEGRPNEAKQFISHGAFLKAYPDFASEHARMLDLQNLLGKGTIGGYAPEIGFILDESLKADPKMGRSTMLHEIQHFIQQREGFPSGGNQHLSPEEYRRLAGEVEARNIQRRMDMTLKQRMATHPWETQDVPESSVINRKDGGSIEDRALEISRKG